MVDLELDLILVNHAEKMQIIAKTWEICTAFETGTYLKYVANFADIETGDYVRFSEQRYRKTLWAASDTHSDYLASIYLFKANRENTKTIYEIYSKGTKKNLTKCDKISLIFLVISLLTWTSKDWLGHNETLAVCVFLRLTFANNPNS